MNLASKASSISRLSPKYAERWTQRSGKINPAADSVEIARYTDEEGGKLFDEGLWNQIKTDSDNLNIFARFGDRISEACERAVREALQRHKAAGNPVAVYRDGAVVLLQPDEIDVEDPSDMR